LLTVSSEWKNRTVTNFTISKQCRLVRHTEYAEFTEYAKLIWLLYFWWYAF